MCLPPITAKLVQKKMKSKKARKAPDNLRNCFPNVSGRNLSRGAMPCRLPKEAQIYAGLTEPPFRFRDVHNSDEHRTVDHAGTQNAELASLRLQMDMNCKCRRALYGAICHRAEGITQEHRLWTDRCGRQGMLRGRRPTTGASRAPTTIQEPSFKCWNEWQHSETLGRVNSSSYSSRHILNILIVHRISTNMQILTLTAFQRKWFYLF